MGAPGTGINLRTLAEEIKTKTAAIETHLKKIKDNKDNVSIDLMFEMQMLMNALQQFSEMSTSVVAASNSAIASMARNVKS